MNTGTYLTSAPGSEISHSGAHEAAMAKFELALTACIQGWHRGDAVVVLQDSIQELFGGVLCDYFKRALLELIGDAASVSIMSTDDGNHTLVHISKKEMPQTPSQENLNAALAVVVSSKQTSIDNAAVAAGLKKAPRPMNCWIIYRDAMHKKLKAEFPHLTVQEISTRCSQLWRELTPEGKKPWQAAAQSAKEEHLRQHPDYKYSPRKPGEKKKRQSRKAKRAASATTGSEVLNFKLASDTTKLAPAPSVEHATAMSTVVGDGGSTFLNDLTQFSGPTDFLDMYSQGQMPADLIHDAESFRHNDLAAEFSAGFDVDLSLALLDDEAFAFRDGADGNATLPSIFTDIY
uniref:MAT1-2 n=2 Tax=Neocamarosporium betae TaxID=1979465 RepID=A0A481XUT3_NEOBT|nr:MAT1-2 [Neocamarosporium betae]QBK47381.1 MAT1-2 [Neocamarosporium betae]